MCGICAVWIFQTDWRRSSHSDRNLQGGVNICFGEERRGRLGMSVRCSHDSMCLLCPAESWERSDSHCDVNRHGQQCQLGGYPRSKKTEWKRDFFTFRTVMDKLNWQLTSEKIYIRHGEIICLLLMYTWLASLLSPVSPSLLASFICRLSYLSVFLLFSDFPLRRVTLEWRQGRKSEWKREEWREMGHQNYKFTSRFSAEALWHTNTLNELCAGEQKVHLTLTRWNTLCNTEPDTWLAWV